MIILLVNCVYGFGSTGKIIKDLKNQFECVGHDVYVAVGRGVDIPSQKVYRLTSRPLMLIQSFASKISGFSYSCSPFSTLHLKRLIREIKPDVVNLHCINANTVGVAGVLTYLKRKNIATVVTCHSEFLYTGGCAYSLSCSNWKNGCKQCPQFHKSASNLPVSWLFNTTHLQWEKLMKAYRGFSTLHITGVSNWLTDRMKESPFFKDIRVSPILNGLDTSVFRYRDYDANRLKTDLNLNGNKTIIHVTPNFYSPIKGGKYVINLAKRMQTLHPEYKFIIVGYNGDKTDIPENVIVIGHTKDQTELADFYSMADVCLLTSERETFSMITAESLCCGTPVVGFKAGGPESFAFPECSSFCEFGNLEELESNLISFLSKKFDKPAISMRACALFSKEIMADNYLKIYKSFFH